MAVRKGRRSDEPGASVGCHCRNDSSGQVVRSTVDQVPAEELAVRSRLSIAPPQEASSTRTFDSREQVLTEAPSSSLPSQPTQDGRKYSKAAAVRRLEKAPPGIILPPAVSF
ncbi:hypothetical protein E2C01_031698 [Portunus trituberculatus]|uniref:Uncharacterized protein n=1 Tax=Portunus trituberculatus TaxID=210409 RepID=A0A5B7F0S6_PORTR|nr:hypothetical protein [Portunus trituberculatus]